MYQQLNTSTLFCYPLLLPTAAVTHFSGWCHVRLCRQFMTEHISHILRVFRFACYCCSISDCLSLLQLSAWCQNSMTMAGLWSYLKTTLVLQLLAGYVVIGSGLVVNFLQLCSCVLWPFSKDLYRKLNRELVELHWCSKKLILLYAYSMIS